MRNFANIKLTKLIPFSILLLIVGLGGFLRFHQIGAQSFNYDEAFQAAVSKIGIIEAIKMDPNMSLYHLLTHFWISVVTPNSEGSLRALSAIFSVASIFVVFLLGKKMSKNQARGLCIGLVASFLFAINAYQIQYAQFFRSYSLTILLTSLSTWLLIKSVENYKKSIWMILYVLISAAAVYSHFIAILLIGSQLITLPLLISKKNIKEKFPTRLYFYFLGLICLILPILLVAINKGPQQISWLPAPTFIDVKDFFTKITGNFGPVLRRLSIFLGLLGFFSWLFKPGREIVSRWKYFLLGSCFLTPVFASFVISKFVLPVFNDRYLIFTTPFLDILVSIGLVTILRLGWDNKKFRIISLIVSVSLLILLSFLQVNGIKKYFDTNKSHDWRSATSFLSSNCGDSLRIYYPLTNEIVVTFYNPDLFMHDTEWTAIISDDTGKINNNNLQEDYDQVCLVLGHLRFGDRQLRADKLREEIRKEFPYEKTYKFRGIDVLIFNQDET